MGTVGKTSILGGDVDVIPLPTIEDSTDGDGGDKVEVELGDPFGLSFNVDEAS